MARFDGLNVCLSLFILGRKAFDFVCSPGPWSGGPFCASANVFFQIPGIGSGSLLQQLCLSALYFDPSAFLCVAGVL